MGKISTKAIIVGFICIILLSIFSQYRDIRTPGVAAGLNILPLNAVVVLIILIAINTILRALKIGLSETDLLYIYCMMLVTAGIVSIGFVLTVIPTTTSIFYYATEENRWAELLHPHIPKWFVPSKPESIKYLWEGLPKGAPIPWSDWLRPFICWAVLAIAIYLVMVSICILLCKQWIKNERLTFPLTRPPLEMCKEEKSKLLSPFLRNKIMWIGFTISAFPFLLNGLNYFFPIIPRIRLFFDLDPFLMEKPWDGLTPMRISICFGLIGFIYLIPTSLIFSLWFFFFFFRAQAVIGSLLGYPMPILFGQWSTRAFIAYQVAGGMIIFCIYLLWTARHELKKIFLPGNENKVYRRAFAGLLIGLLVIGLWGILTGASFIFVLGVFVLFFLIVLAGARLSAEGGMFYFTPAITAPDIIMAFTGSTALGVKNIVNIVGPVGFIFMRFSGAALLPTAMNAFKISEAGNLARRKFLILVAGAILLGMIVSYVAHLIIMYDVGGINARGWYVGGMALWGAQQSARLLTFPQAPNLTYMISFLVGCISMVVLLVLRSIFLWFPLHPLGYVLGDSVPTVMLFFPIMLGWLLKVIILRFGGITLYRKLLPGFLGLALGRYTMIGLWVIIDMITGTGVSSALEFL